MTRALSGRGSRRVHGGPRPHLAVSGPPDEGTLLDRELEVGAEEADDARPVQREQLGEAARRRTAREEREEPVEVALDVTHPVLVEEATGHDELRQDGIHPEQRVEDGAVARSRRVGAPDDVVADVLGDEALDVGRAAWPSSMTARRGRSIRSMSKTSSGSAQVRQGDGRELPARDVGRDQGALERLEGAACALGMGLEEPAVVRHRELEHDEGPDLAPVVEGRRARTEGGEALTGQVSQRAPVRRRPSRPRNRAWRGTARRDGTPRGAPAHGRSGGRSAACRRR